MIKNLMFFVVILFQEEQRTTLELDAFEENIKQFQIENQD